MKRFLQNDFHMLDDRPLVERLEVLEGPSGRRNWSDEEKVRIILESFQPGVKVGDVAQRNGMSPQHLSTWRSLAREAKIAMPPLPDETGLFAPVEIAEDVTRELAEDCAIEIVADGFLVRVPEDMAAGRIAEIAAALRAL